MDAALKLSRVFLAVTGWAVMVANPALSQGIAAPRAAGDRLTVMVDVNEGVDSELPPEFLSQVSPGDSLSGGYSTMLTATADYARNRRRLQLAGTALTSFRYFERLNQVAPVTHTAGLGANVRLPKQSSLQINQTATYAPSYLYQLFPVEASPGLGQSIPADPNYRVATTESYLYGTKAAFAVGAPRRLRFTATEEYNRSDFQGTTQAGTNLTTYATGARVARAVTRNSGLSVEYQYHTGEFGVGGLTKEHRVSVGVDYSRALSTTRRATFHVDVTPATLVVPATAFTAITTNQATIPIDGEGPVAAERHLHQWQSDASVEYQFRPSWRATASYHRGVDYLVLLTEPIFSDGARAGVTGLISRRVAVSASAGYATGTGASTIDRSSQNLETRIGEVRIAYAMTRTFALYTDYLHYYYDLRGQANLAPELPPAFAQHAIRVGFTLSVRPLGR